MPTKKLKSYCYSPQPIEHYFINSVSECEAKRISDLDRHDATWNLFWLSNPTISLVQDAGYDWWAVHKVKETGLSAVIQDVLEDEVMFFNVTKSPDQFIKWFRREDHSIYECYYAYGGEEWVKTVLARAEEALKLSYQALGHAGIDNVVQANFGRRAA